MKKLSGFSVIELLIIISMVTALIIVAAPSFYGLFKKQFLIYHSNQLIQNIKSIQSNAFIENKDYKIGFDSIDKTYTIWAYLNSQWQENEHYEFDETVSIEFGNVLSNNHHILYNHNGNTYFCTSTNTPTECESTPLTTKAWLTLKTEKKDIIIEFMPINGYVSSNVGVK